MLNNIFQGLSDARVLPKETNCPSGQAIAIFESRMLAESALESIERNCLVMADRKWPVIASRVKESVNEVKFPGHLGLEKLKLGRTFVSEDYIALAKIGDRTNGVTFHDNEQTTITYREGAQGMQSGDGRMEEGEIKFSPMANWQRSTKDGTRG
ncbi:hypothetical protein L7F22_005292 [Adiantum nelumboides]|nr:hypothetical protein [Adiantum nelumboides]